MRKKTLIAIISIVLVVVIISGTLVAVFVPKSKNSADSQTDELLVREILNGYSANDIVNDPDWQEDMIDATENYIMVDAMRFDFSKEIGVNDGTTYLYYDHDTKKINEVMHYYVNYTNDSDPKAEPQNAVGNIQTNISALLGNPSEPLMLMNTSGEFKDYDGLTVDEMIEKVISGDTVMYTMYESNGLRYEMNIMFSDNTIYMMVWICDEKVLSENVEHEH